MRLTGAEVDQVRLRINGSTKLNGRWTKVAHKARLSVTYSTGESVEFDVLGIYLRRAEERGDTLYKMPETLGGVLGARGWAVVRGNPPEWWPVQ